MYKIMLNEEQVGQAHVKREGLYYKITCVCNFSDGKIHRVVVRDGESAVRLGICIPKDDKFYLSTRIPAKHLLGENLYFSIESDCAGIPVFAGKPFPHLDKLETARLQFTNGQPSILID